MRAAHRVNARTTTRTMNTDMQETEEEKKNPTDRRKEKIMLDQAPKTESADLHGEEHVPLQGKEKKDFLLFKDNIEGDRKSVV